MVDVVRPQSYYAASTAVSGAAATIARVHSATMGAISGAGEMAGTDETGEKFATAYDSLASAFESLGRNLTDGVHNYARVLRQAGINHADAEAKSNIGRPPPPASPPDPGQSPLTQCMAVQSAKGGVGAGLQEVIGLLQAAGIPIPNGDTDKLGKVANAFSRVASGDVAGARDQIQKASESFSELNGVEVDAVVEDLEELSSAVDSYLNAASNLREAVQAHQEYLHEVRRQLNDLLEDLAKDLAVDAAISIGITALSFGFGGTVAAAKLTETVARYGKKIKDVVSAVRKINGGRKIENAAEKVAEIESEVDRLLRFLRMELKNATSRGQRNNISGRIGELKAGIDPNLPKTPIEINGRTRIPDLVDLESRTVKEVKNVNSLSATRQLKDMIDFSEQRGYRFELVVDSRTRISGQLQDLINSGRVSLTRMDLN
jgi:hypothetical protein